MYVKRSRGQQRKEKETSAQETITKVCQSEASLRAPQTPKLHGFRDIISLVLRAGARPGGPGGPAAAASLYYSSRRKPWQHIGCYRGIGYARRRRKGPRAAVLQILKMGLFIPHARCTLLLVAHTPQGKGPFAQRRPPGHRSQVTLCAGCQTTKASNRGPIMEKMTQQAPSLWTAKQVFKRIRARFRQATENVSKKAGL